MLPMTPDDVRRLSAADAAKIPDTQLAKGLEIVAKEAAPAPSP